MFAQAITNLSSFFAYPMDTVRRRLMMTSGQINPKYTGTLDCITKISKQEGWKGFYKGFTANLMRGVGGALVLVFYDKLSIKFNV